MPPTDDNPYTPPKSPTNAALRGVGDRLFRSWVFWGLVVTQFLGAFNDNLFKQLMLLLAVPLGAGSFEPDQQALATIVFSLPFVLFSGFAGWLSDRYSKQPLIVGCKLAEIAILLLGMAAFINYPSTGYVGLLGVLWLMGMHSAFFGPGKYGILPELFPEEDLPRANGMMLMTTFLAIIFGTAAAGLWGDMARANSEGERDLSRLWMGSLVCVSLAVVGTLSSLLIRRPPPANPRLPFSLDVLAVPAEMRRLLWRDRSLAAALLASCMFWLVGGLAMQSVNSLGLVQLGLSASATSLLTATIGLGIAGGAVLAGRLSGGHAHGGLVRAGAWGMCAGLVLMALCGSEGQHVLGYGGSFPVLVLLGVSSGCFAIPVQVFLQSRPPADQKGRMIAVMNQANFVAILLSGAVYALFDQILIANAWPRCLLFAGTAAVLLPVALFYRPRFEP